VTDQPTPSPWTEPTGPAPAAAPAAPPTAEGQPYAESWPSAPPKSGVHLSLLTLIIGTVVLLGIGFGGGALVFHKSSTASAANTSFRNGGGFGAGAQGQFPGNGGAGNGGAAGGGPNAGRFARAGAIGTITKVDGNTVYVKTQAGGTVTVTTSSATTVTKSSKAKVSDLAAGEVVIVRGDTSNGTTAATSITASPAGSTPFGGGFGGGPFGGRDPNGGAPNANSGAN
jgi:hypothetical protein